MVGDDLADQEMEGGHLGFYPIGRKWHLGHSFSLVEMFLQLCQVSGNGKEWLPGNLKIM